jgi:hypothetical protein
MDAEQYEESAPEMARLYRAQAACYDDAAALAWSHQRAYSASQPYEPKFT